MRMGFTNKRKTDRRRKICLEQRKRERECVNGERASNENEIEREKKKKRRKQISER